VPAEVCVSFFLASSTALVKKSRRIRPIAVGCILRRLLAKIAGSLVVEDMAEFLSPRPLAYGVHGDAEVAVHAARKFLLNLRVVGPW